MSPVCFRAHMLVRICPRKWACVHSKVVLVGATRVRRVCLWFSGPNSEILRAVKAEDIVRKVGQYHNQDELVRKAAAAFEERLTGAHPCTRHTACLASLPCHDGTSTRSRLVPSCTKAFWCRRLLFPFLL
jgi:hypothetical protein